jgi:hypothetical protein
MAKKWYEDDEEDDLLEDEEEMDEDLEDELPAKVGRGTEIDETGYDPEAPVDLPESPSYNPRLAGKASKVPEISEATAEEDLSKYEGMSQAPGSLTMYKRHLSEMPQRENPRLIQKILAALAGVGVATKNPAAGVATTQELLDRPHEMSLRDWTLKGKGLGEVADIERYENANLLRALQQNATAEYRRQAEAGRNQRFQESEQGRDRRVGASEQGRNRRAVMSEEGRNRRVGFQEGSRDRRAATTRGGRTFRRTASELQDAEKEAHERVLKRFPQYKELFETDEKTGLYGPKKSVKVDPKTQKKGRLDRWLTKDEKISTGESYYDAYANYERILEAEKKRIEEETSPQPVFPKKEQ